MAQFIEELRRRHVFKVMASYAVIAWLLRYLRTGSYMPFVVYRLGLAAVIAARDPADRSGSG